MQLAVQLLLVSIFPGCVDQQAWGVDGEAGEDFDDPLDLQPDENYDNIEL